MRDDFSPAMKEVLAKRVGFRCSNPACRQLTSGPQVDTTKTVNVGVAAHITAASVGGPRYDASLTPDVRSHPDNGIWLCQKCGKLVDNDAARYPESLLREWRMLAEETANREVQGGPSQRPATPPDNPLHRIIDLLVKYHRAFGLVHHARTREEHDSSLDEWCRHHPDVKDGRLFPDNSASQTLSGGIRVGSALAGGNIAIRFGCNALSRFLQGRGECFPAGTPVHTVTGVQAIEEIAAGDRVWAYDHKRLSWTEREVVEVYQLIHTGTMATIQVRGEVIRATGGHPFWVVRGEQLARRPLPKRIQAYQAGALVPCPQITSQNPSAFQEVLLRHGEVVAIESVRLDDVEEMVYNFHVAELQNYAVGDCGILVHNANENANENADEPQMPEDPPNEQFPGQNALRLARERAKKRLLDEARRRLQELGENGDPVEKAGLQGQIEKLEGELERIAIEWLGGG
jgi:Intein splicing domain